MIPWSDGIAARRFPVVNVALIVANFAVFLRYELPDPDAAIRQASFYPCNVETLAKSAFRGTSAGLRRCSCTPAGTTFWATCCFW